MRRWIFRAQPIHRQALSGQASVEICLEILEVFQAHRNADYAFTNAGLLAGLR